MSDDTANLVLEHLRAIRADLSEVRSGVARLDVRMGTIETHPAGFQLSEVRQNSELDQLRARLDRIEKRLELVEP
ncbi:MAG: hypothetical protein NW203_14655 [Hyphomonadaceae bacterium]|nr:hypothetical protein [Hyphomonadaceae bacterium]